QYCCSLAYAKMCEQHDLTVGKLKCIVMRARVILIDLPELGHLVLEYLLASFADDKLEPSQHTFYFIFKPDLSATKKTHGGVGLSDRGKSTCSRVAESRCD